MRIRWKLAALSIVVAGCSSVAVKEDGGTPAAPVPSPPSATLFASSIEPLLESNSCGNVGCHATATNSGSLALKVPTSVPAPSASDVTYNYKHATCSPHLASYNPPTGNFVAYFCDSASTPHPGGHKGINYSAGDCTSLFTWVMTANSSATPAACPAP